MGFDSPLQLESIRGTNSWELTGELVYYSEELEVTFTVPSGTITDFASIPKLLRFFIDNDSPIIRDAAVLHDFLYSILSNETYGWVTKEMADSLLKEAMKDLGAGWIKQNTVYWSVRTFGGIFYKGDDE